jgi:hypothetical protein
MRVSEFIAALRYGFGQREASAVAPFEGNHGLMSAWLVVTNVVGVDLAPKTSQSIFMSGTQYVRWPSLAIRYGLSRPRYDMVVPRLFAVASYSVSNNLKFKMYDDNVIGAIYTPRGVRFVEASGHMINMLLMSSFGVLDYQHYLTNVISNVHAFFTNGPDRRQIKSAARKNRLMERQNNDFSLWHTYLDYKISLLAVIYTCAFWRFPVPVRHLRATYVAIESLHRQYPNFDRNLKTPDTTKLRRTILR